MRTLTIKTHKETLQSLLLDIGSLGFIYMVPTISHLFSLPIYLIEPMRLMLIFALVHTSKANAFIIALSLPAFSYFISGHPVLPKMILISLELLLNVLLFYGLVKKFKFLFPSIFLSILLSKAIYYLIKFELINLAILDTELFSTSIYLQLIMTLIFSLYLYAFYDRSKIS
ncbi:MAG: hypothetical protein A2W85_01885 [Bacteroidetes bacterium GWF2_41_31]|nr:MAG: hypothetical protein A2W85_01885 [Bacteroidetes bacterium GWF2_41_31]OFZ08653.1 MAG: hypothetical protein A2338_10505 [Bacteroidetes bacterium RIFOXYB12_FULL_41_6]